MSYCCLMDWRVTFQVTAARNFVTSVAAVAGFSRDERAYLGRWSMGMVASEEYVRTSRQVVFKIQKAVNRCLVEGTNGPYFEDEAIQRLCDAAEATGANPNRIRKRHAVLGDWSGSALAWWGLPNIGSGSMETGQNWMGMSVGDIDLADKVATLTRKEALSSDGHLQVLCDHFQEDMPEALAPQWLLCEA